jgi:phosphate transport system permease protein
VKTRLPFRFLLAEALIKALGYSSAVVVLLIVFFLFKEGVGLFTRPPINEDMTVAASPARSQTRLSTAQLVAVFDKEITDWAELDGAPGTILPISPDNIEKVLKGVPLDEATLERDIPRLLDSLVVAQPGVLLIFPAALLPANVQPLDVDPQTLGGFLRGRNWYPTKNPVPEFGAISLIAGTALVTLLAILIALPLGLAVAIFLAEIATPAMRGLIKPAIELLAGIPSVVYGFFGLVVLVPMLQQALDLSTGKTALAGGIILAIIALPTIITLSEDALRTTPRALKEASLALGATHWQTIVRVVVPFGFSGIAAATILGVGRAVGETMAVLMVTGNAAILPESIASPVRTLTATIAAELGEAPQGGPHYRALFVVGMVLFVITFAFNLLADFIVKRKRINLN